jgi:hypothetical protein
MSFGDIKIRDIAGYSYVEYAEIVNYVSSIIPPWLIVHPPLILPLKFRNFTCIYIVAGTKLL